MSSWTHPELLVVAAFVGLAALGMACECGELAAKKEEGPGFWAFTVLALGLMLCALVIIRAA